MIEQPYSGRATITDNISQVDIVIPARKNWLLVPFMCVWLCFWLFGIFTAGKALFTTLHHGPPALFMIVWLTMWTTFGFAGIYFVTWSLFGKEYISVGNGLLTIRRKNAIFFKPKSYDLLHITNMVAKERNIYQVRRAGIGSYMGNMGTIGFDYGFKTIRFGDGLDEAEARHIIELLRSRKFVN